MQPTRPWPTDGSAPGMKESKVTLVARDPADAEQFVQAWRVGDKRALIANTRGPLWAFWHGQRSNHMFDIDRANAAEEIGEGKDVTREVAELDRLLIEWFHRQSKRAELATVAPSMKAENVAAAHRVNATGPRERVKAVAWFALTDIRWTGRIRSVEQLWRSWDLIVGDWKRAGEPEWEAP
jgi:hypothetical protein